MVSEEKDEREREKVADAGKRATRNVRKLRSDKEVKKSALALQQMIVGNGNDGLSPIGGPKSKPVTRSELKKIKSQLMSPKSANKVIAILRDLPMSEHAVSKDATSKSGTSGPIHAVCLEMPDAEANEKHFCKLKSGSSTILDAIPSFANATFDSIVPLFNDLHIVSLISAPDLGLGKTAEEDGILAGALPSAEAVIDGAVQITPQLMALGYATGRAVVPDHTDVHPPLDRISVFTYWWGLELCIPEPSMKNLANGNNITHTVMNLLTALSLINGGVAEVLPFIRYISQFVDFEWNAIKAQDKGKGVVCAATWIMPAAMVPRPWDFPDPPAPVKKDAKAAKHSTGGHESAGNAVPVPSQDENQGVLDNISIQPAILPSLVVSPPKQDEIAEAT
ncbi:hypothetical protein SCHPADRAFT_817929 [Schizopora paradoxa]|uniref:Uncharacterized protein n=1 Tax=Schizopora paradoxa TaxID=27342 RepID=A0A0H2S5N6_9AGAM|nr:hypothetical protein SCHPADRAFT_817929 [Schizopora paradoxa]